jgi:hypothetical protein
MIIYKRILGFLISFLLSGILILLNYYPHLIVYLAIISVFLLFFYFWKVKNRFITNKLLTHYFLISLLFLLSVWLFFITIDNILIKYAVALLLFIYLAFVFDHIFKKIYENIEISAQIFVYLDLVCFWLFSYFLFYSYIILNLSVFVLVLILLLITVLLTFLRFYWKNIDAKKEILYILIICIVMIELYLATLFLSFSFYLSALVLWFWYYFIMDFSVDKILETFIWRKNIKFIVMAILIFILSILTIK